MAEEQPQPTPPSVAAGDFADWLNGTPLGKKLADKSGLLGERLTDVGRDR